MRRLLRNFEEILSSIFIIVTVTIVIMNVMLRYIFNTGIPWSEEVATISFVWSVFVGASACYKHKMHIGIDLITKLFPIRLQGIMTLVVDLLMIVINGYIVYLSAVFTVASINKPTSVLGVSSAYVNVSLLAGFGLMTIHAIVFFIKDFKALNIKSDQIEKNKVI